MRRVNVWKVAHWLALIVAVFQYGRTLFQYGQYYSHAPDIPPEAVLAGLLDGVISYVAVFAFWGVVMWVVVKIISILSKASSRFREFSMDDHSEL